MVETIDLKNLIEEFLKDSSIMNGDRIYNEFSLQFELGFFLRDKLKDIKDKGEGFKVQFERNVEDFFQIPPDLKGKQKDSWIEEKHSHFIKSEMDLVIFKDFNSDSDKYAIELKFPSNKTPNKRIPHFLEDIIFMENVKNNLGFKKTYCLTLVPNNANGDAFRKGQQNDKSHQFYKYFRGDFSKDPVQAIKGVKGYNTEKKHKTFSIEGNYKPIEWEHMTDYCFYYLLETNLGK